MMVNIDNKRKIRKKLLSAISQAFPVASIHADEHLQVSRYRLRHRHYLFRAFQKCIAGRHSVLIPHIDLLAQSLQSKPQSQSRADSIAIGAEMRRDRYGATLLYARIEIFVHLEV